MKSSKHYSVCFIEPLCSFGQCKFESHSYSVPVHKSGKKAKGKIKKEKNIFKIHIHGCIRCHTESWCFCRQCKFESQIWLPTFPNPITLFSNHFLSYLTHTESIKVAKRLKIFKSIFIDVFTDTLSNGACFCRERKFESDIS